MFVFPELSVAVHSTAVAPTGNTEPDGGTQTTVASPQLSVAVGKSKSTREPLSPGTELANTSSRQVNCGGSVSLTVTVNEQLPTPFTLLAVQVTVETPAGNECGDVTAASPIRQRTVGMGDPEPTTVNVTERAQLPPAASVTILPGHCTVGAE